MTERHAAYLVTLAESVREDDAVDIITALEQIKGVISVLPLTDSPSVMIGTERARTQMRAQMLDAIDQTTRRK